MARRVALGLCAVAVWVVVADGEVPAIPPRSCDRDEAATAPWGGLAVEDRVWSAASVARVEAALAAAPAVLDAPRVFVYPFPEAFANATRLLERANVTGADADFLIYDALARARADADPARRFVGAFRLDYVHLAYGVKHWNARGQAWARDGRGRLTWTPPSASRKPRGFPFFFDFGGLYLGRIPVDSGSFLGTE